MYVYVVYIIYAYNSKRTHTYIYIYMYIYIYICSASLDRWGALWLSSTAKVLEQHGDKAELHLWRLEIYDKVRMHKALLHLI